MRDGLTLTVRTLSSQKGRGMLDMHNLFGLVMRVKSVLTMNPSAYACSINVQSALRLGRDMFDMHNPFGQIMRDGLTRQAE